MTTKLFAPPFYLHKISVTQAKAVLCYKLKGTTVSRV